MNAILKTLVAGSVPVILIGGVVRAEEQSVAKVAPPPATQPTTPPTTQPQPTPPPNEAVAGMRG